jgi:hypothetical protein
MSCPASECIEYPGWRNPAGYGKRKYKGQTQFTHRVAYCEHHGLAIVDIAAQVVRHKCDNPPCINPEHLELGTYSDNSQDRKARGRQATKAGEANGKCVLSDSEVASARAAYTGAFGEKAALARRFGVSKNQMGRIINQQVRLWPSESNW